MPPPAGVDIDQQWYSGGRGDPLGIDQHVAKGGHAEIRQAVGGIGYPGAGEIEGLKTAALGHQRHISIDGADDLQGMFIGKGGAKAQACRGGQTGHHDSFHLSSLAI